jgi:hypothetical protein
MAVSTKIARTTSCATANGGSGGAGASVCRNHSFWNACAIWLLEPALPAMADEAGWAGAASVARGNDLPASPCLGVHDAIPTRVSIEKDVEDAVCGAVLPELCGRLAAAEIG